VEVENEMARLKRDWSAGEVDPTADVLARVLTEEEIGAIDPFDRVQLAEVVRVCRESRSLSDAGRQLFCVSREKKKSANDADRLAKYLARFELNWQRIVVRESR